jgi:moderate conductance mechanosensitive channel
MLVRIAALVGGAYFSFLPWHPMTLRQFTLPSLLLLFAASVLSLGSAAWAQNTPPPSASAAPPPEKLDQLIELLSDPAIKEWVAKQAQAPATSAQPAAPAGAMEESAMSSMLSHIKSHLERLAAAVTRLPQEFGRARDIMMLEFADRGLIGIFLLIAIFVAVGAALSQLAHWRTAELRKWIVSLPKNTPQGRAKKLGGRFIFGLTKVGAFMLGSAGAFLLFEWPPLLREIVLLYLSAAIITWAVLTFLRFALLPPHISVPNAIEVRALPMSDARAMHWYRWIVAATAIFMLIGATFTLLPTLGFDRDSVLALAIPADLLMLVIGLAAVWLRPKVELGGGATIGRIGPTAVTWLLTIYFILLFLIRTSGSFILFWFAVAVVALPATILAMHRAVHYVLRAPEGDTDAKPIAAVTLAVVDRGIRIALVALAAYLLARVWGLDMQSMRTQSPLVSRILDGLLSAVVIALAADFVWSIIKAVIERKLGVIAPAAAAGDSEEQHHAIDPQQARLLTLLPIVQNILFAAIVVMAILMILSSIGVQIGPLIAGAGVLGVAIGFGAQTLVKDIISGMFYLLDDAFRVGEYITSGKYMGTVESFSLRSVKLRHHRGPLFTIPFGELGAVQNSSRDWVTDKFNITVGFDTDLEAARKLIKKIGIELAADPEYAPSVIVPIKMQGVQGFGEYGIDLRMKMTTKPGEGFSMKRKFYVRIRQAFKEAGIILPSPTVHVQQDEAAIAAAAQNLVSRNRKKKAAAAAAADE